MVLLYYGAGSAAGPTAARAYDPVLRGSLITTLAASARSLGFDAEVEKPPADSLVTLLEAGVPPILLYGRGIGPVSRLHYGVVVGWDPERREFLLQDGGARPRRMRPSALEGPWRSAGGLALVVRRVP